MFGRTNAFKGGILKEHPDTLGVLGGMGPAATLEFLEKLLKLTGADTDQEQIPTITYNNCKIPDRNEAYLRNGESPVSELVRSAKVLESAGADIIAMPCNTAHIWFDSIRESTSVEILNMLEITSDCIPGTAKVGIISTTPVKLSGLYSDILEKRGIPVIYGEDQNEIMKAIYLVKSGKLDEAKQVFMKQISQLESKGVDHILAGCTEVPVAISQSDVQSKLVDPMECLALECIRRFGKD